jgi:tetratricopeptide (TPR) repeat protein
MKRRERRKERAAEGFFTDRTSKLLRVQAKSADLSMDSIEEFQVAPGLQRGRRTIYDPIMDQEASSLIDQAMALQNEGDTRGAIALFERAFARARDLNDRLSGSEALAGLGLVALAGGMPQTALDHFKKELAFARAAGDQFAEKNALAHLSYTFSELRDPSRALAWTEQALHSARTLQDPLQEANLLWFQAIAHAELGQSDLAMTRADEAVRGLQTLGAPYADIYKDHLQKYQAGTPSTSSAPGLLRMAYSLAKAGAEYLRSGMQKVSPEIHRDRLQTCAACEHFTGVRCRPCGCFVNSKAWLPYESCPLRKWPV